MPLIRCDYSPKLMNDELMRGLVKELYDASAVIFNYNEQDAQDKISIFSAPFGPFDHSTASVEVEIRARVQEFDRPDQSRDEVRDEYLKRYEDSLLPYLREANLQAPIILTITFQDWQVNVLTSEGSRPNSPD